MGRCHQTNRNVLKYIRLCAIINIISTKQEVCMNQAKVTLQIKRKWFDLIASGHKKEEYRACSAFNNNLFAHKANATQVTFINGYRKDAPRITLQLIGVTKGLPKKEWCEDDMSGVEMWVLSLGEVISPHTQP